MEVPATGGQRQDLIALLRERSLEFGSLRLASGKVSSYYVDARRTTMSARGLALVGDLGLQAIRNAGWGPALVGGLTLGADPVAYAIARASSRGPTPIDAFTVRRRAKEHGTGRRIEGCFRPGAPVVVVDDVLTTGGSILEAAAALTAAGARIVGVLAVVDREEGGRAAIEDAGYPFRALVGVGELGVARERERAP